MVSENSTIASNFRLCESGSECIIEMNSGVHTFASTLEVTAGMVVTLRPMNNVSMQPSEIIILQGINGGEFPLFTVRAGGTLKVTSDNPTLSLDDPVQITKFGRSSIFAEGASSVVLERVALVRNDAGSSAQRRRTLSSTAALEHPGCGGGLRLVSGAMAKLSKCILSNNTAEHGGAICARGSSIIVLSSSTELKNNLASINGGGLSASSAAIVRIEGGVSSSVLFELNQAQQHGGGIALATDAKLLSSGRSCTNASLSHCD